jgi:hypothetical protein
VTFGPNNSSSKFFQINSGSGAKSTDIRVALGGSGSVQVEGAGNAVTFTSGTLNQAVTAGGDVTLTLGKGSTNNSNSTQVVAGKIVDNTDGKVGVSISSQTWVLNGNSTYTGATSVASDAKLLMNGLVNSGTTTSTGYLGGSGTFGGAVSIVSGTLAPGGTSTSGVITDSIGKLAVGSLSLSSPATTAMTITGSTAGLYDQVASTGLTTFGGALKIDMNMVSSLITWGTNAYSNPGTNGTSWSLFNSGSFAGNFSSVVMTGSFGTLNFRNYNGNNNLWVTDDFDNHTKGFAFYVNSVNGGAAGTLYAVPEPSTIVFAGIGMAMFGWSTWTRRRAKVRREIIEAGII